MAVHGSMRPSTRYVHVAWVHPLCCRYRAPECLLTDGYYNYKMDMWGVGCVMFEIVALYPLFPGEPLLPVASPASCVCSTEAAARASAAC